MTSSSLLFLWKEFPEGRQKVDQFQKNLGFIFQEEALLVEALTHRSASNQARFVKGFPDSLLPPPWNERLEFLGDSVLGLIVSSILFRDKAQTEGELSKAKSQLVNESTLAHIARSIKLDQALLLSTAEQRLNTHHRDSILCDALEALIGAMYLDSDYDTVAPLVEEWFGKHTTLHQGLIIHDPKSQLQELAQKHFQKTPLYHLEGEEGPSHKKSFSMAVYLDDRRLGEGKGPNKKIASRRAAQSAMGVIEPMVSRQEKLS